ncbi:MAG: lysine--tRNA ligase [Spartobacteria bacterium]|nr:lysine--tRNA ligase [Spartobacteria bacterium]
MQEEKQSGTGDEVFDQRVLNMEKLKSMGYEPFGHAFERTGDLVQVREGFEEGKQVRVAGRLVTRRSMGKSCFAHVQDGSGKFQIYVRRDVVGEDPYAAFKILDIGDQIGCVGTLFLTKTGEQSLKVESWELLSKALRPLPEKFHGLNDTETRYRQRYLDLIANPDVRDVFNKRIQIMREIRNFLADREFMEVETPMLQAQAGGATACPFKTYYNALSTDMYMRIAPELYLKQLMVGGFGKIFELNRNFRNEGLDRRHNPEFTMMEIYEAFGSMESMRQLVQDMIIHLAQKVFGRLKFTIGENEVDLSPEAWRSVPYKELVMEKAGADWFDLSREAKAQRAAEMGVDVDSAMTDVELTNEVYEKCVERTLINPTFVTRIPKELLPLAKRCADDPDLVDVFELEINGIEIAPGYTELNDPIDQRARLMEQAGDDTSKLDEEFLTALEHGMPPAGGMGVGIDRLVMILTESESIRDVILFPHLKPRD